MPDATGLELIAQELRERTRTSVLDTLYFRDKAALTVTAPARSARRSSTCAARASTSSPRVHGVDYFPEEPRLGVHYELLDMYEVDRMTVKVRVPLDAPERAVASSPTGRPPTTRSARSTTCSA